MGEMVAVMVPVVVWSHNNKRNMSCSVSVDTTFQDVIDELGLDNMHSALVGHRNVPFKLMVGDFAWPTGERLSNSFVNQNDRIVKWWSFRFCATSFAGNIFRSQ